MTTNFHTPWIDSPATGFTVFTAASMNPTLAQLDAVLSWLLFPHTLTSGASVEVDWTDAAVQFLDLAHDATISFAGGLAGRRYILAVRGNGQSPSWPADVRYGTDIASIELSAEGWDYLAFIYNGVDDTYDLVSIAKGFGTES